MSDSDSQATLDIHQILKLLPHRYPFLLIDRILDFEAGVHLKALKNVSMNEPFFPGHFPQRPVMPGVLITEAMAQASAVFAFQTKPELLDGNSLYYFAGMDKARFKRPVEPGDQLIIEISFERIVRTLWFFKGSATVDGKVVASADLMGTVRNIES